MSYKASVYKVMIASPSDVSAERSIVREVLSEWNVVNADRHKQVLCLSGGKHTPFPRWEIGRNLSLIGKSGRIVTC
jgi:hypothetical protein